MWFLPCLMSSIAWYSVTAAYSLNYSTVVFDLEVKHHAIASKDIRLLKDNQLLRSLLPRETPSQPGSMREKKLPTGLI
jgi:hypothetical protein